MFDSRTGWAKGVLVLLLIAGFILPLWYWLPVRAVQLYLPEPISFDGQLGHLIHQFLHTVWPTGVIVPIVSIETAPIAKALKTLSSTVPSQVAIIASLAAVGFVVWCGLAACRRRQLPPMGTAAMSLTILLFFVFVFLEAWRMPLDRPAAILAGVACVLTLLFLVVVLSLLAVRRSACLAAPPQPLQDTAAPGQ
jgi:hypothetical protein